MTFTRTEHPEFSWSHSRDRTLRECERRYYWQYYGGHNGWETGAPLEARAAWRLKKLTAFPMALGSEIHLRAREVAEAVRDGRPLPDHRTLWDRTRGALNRLHLRSSDRDAFIASPGRHPITADAYYGRAADRARLAALREKAERCLTHLLTCPVWDEMRAGAPPGGRPDVRVIDDLAHVHVDGVKVYVAPDLVFRTPRAGWVVVDWKTGDDAGVEEQLALYALYLRDGLGLPLRGGACECRVVHLDGAHVDTFVVTEADLTAARARVAASAGRMRQFLADAAANVPRPKAEFALETHGRRCRFCNYYELCAEELCARALRGAPVSISRGRRSPRPDAECPDEDVA